MSAKQTSYLKIGLVIVLAIIFVGVMANSVLTILRASPPPPPPARNASNVHAQATPSKPVAASHTAAVPPATPVTKALHDAPPVETSKSAWPKFALDEIIAYDPFAKAGDPTASSKSSAPGSGDTGAATSGATDNSKAASTESEPAFTGRIHAVYQRHGRSTALVGSKTVRSGDQLEGAGRVVEVDQSGLMLEMKK